MKWFVHILSWMVMANGLLLSNTPGQAQSPVAPVVFAAPPPPRGIGSPGNRTEAGSRPVSCRQGTKLLTALVPIYPASQVLEVVWGKTVAAQPTLWFYVPYTSASATGEFVLEDVKTKQQTSFKVPLAAKSGVVQVPLANQASLQVGKPYRWYFNIYCGDRPEIAEINSFVEGDITRETFSPALQRQVNQANLQQKVSLFAANGIWYEALTAASALQCARANDPHWTGLLQAVGLDKLTQEPIANCQKTTR